MPTVDQSPPRVPPYSAHLETALFDAMQALSRAGHAAQVIGRDAATLRLMVALEAVRGLLTEEQRARPPAPEQVRQPASDWAGAHVSIVGGDFDGARGRTT